MDVSFYGANCFLIEVNKSKFLIDPYPKEYSSKQPSFKDVGCVLRTGMYRATDELSGLFTIDTPGEYEKDSAVIKGIQTVSALSVHDGEEDVNVVFTMHANDLGICIVGNPKTPLSEDILEQISTIDVLLIPVGGGGVSLNPEQAAQVVKQIEPKLCVASHFSQQGISYPVEQLAVKQFFDEMGKGKALEENKLKIKATTLPEDLEVVAFK